MRTSKHLLIGLMSVVFIAVTAGLTSPIDSQAGSKKKKKGFLEAPGVNLFFEKRVGKPRPPKIPKNFVGWGRYIVRDLRVDVPFSWQGNDGNSHMIAGSPRRKDPIHFENLIYEGYLYTVTYKWPTPIPNPGKCSQIPIPIDRKLVNKFFASSSFVGRERLLDKGRPFEVHHFRVSLVLPIPLEPIPLRLPLLSADLYVDPRDPRIFKQVLHFGLQNLYAPRLDEWFVMKTFKLRKGEVTLPTECEHPMVMDMDSISDWMDGFGFENLMHD